MKEMFALNYPGKKTNWDEIWLTAAFAIAHASHCVSYQVAAIIVKDNRPIVSGINGTPAGCDNCDQIFPARDDPKFVRAEHTEFSDAYEIHAEKNAINFAAKNNINITQATMYCTTQPCKSCLKDLLESGLARIVYAEKYDRANYPEMLLAMAARKGIKIEHMPLDLDKIFAEIKKERKR